MNTWIEKQKEKQNKGTGLASYANNEGANKYGHACGAITKLRYIENGKEYCGICGNVFNDEKVSQR